MEDKIGVDTLTKEEEDRLFNALTKMRTILANTKICEKKLTAAEQLQQLKLECHALLNLIETIEINKLR